MRRWYTILLFLAVSGITRAQNYPVDGIADSLKEGSNAVIRLSKGHFQILAANRAKLRIEKVVTILNEKGKRHAQFLTFYDKLSGITDIDYRVYDAVGKQVSKVKQSEIYDQSAISGFSLYEDNRLKFIAPPKDQAYPYTVKYSYTLNYRYLYQIPSWYFLPGEDVALESSLYQITYPEEVGIRYKEILFSGEKKEWNELDGAISIQWQLEGLGSKSFELYAGSKSDQIPRIMLAPEKFEFEGYAGNMSTWDGLATWIHQLNESLQFLPEEFKEELRRETEQMDRIEKIKYVYHYLQEHTRYVSIQLGLGGFQPFAPSVVHKNGYGDCKALSYYTKSMLSSIGIDSYYTIISAGNNPQKIDRDFPLSNFNHVILCVPNETDTVWLECTSQTNPFGYLGTFTGDREALLIKEGQAHIVQTKSYPDEENTQRTVSQIQVSKDGSASITQQLQLSGLKSEALSRVINLSPEEQEDYLIKYFNITTFEIKSFEIDRSDNAEVSLTSTIEASKLLASSGSRLFLQPNVTNRNTFTPVKDANRETDIHINIGYHEYDTLAFKIPENFRLEAIFEPILIESAFGKYEAQIIEDGSDRFRYVRHFYQRKGIFDKSDYPAFVNFYKRVARSDKKKIALISKT